MNSIAVPVGVALRPRAFVRVSGPQAGDYLQRMLSNDLLALGDGESCDALLLTPKARVIATARVLRRGPDDFLLLTEPELGDVLVQELLRMRFAARCTIELEPHPSYLQFGDVAIPAGAVSVPNPDYGVPCREVVGMEPPPDQPRLDHEVERMRIQAGTPLFGREIDDRVLPAEAGLDERAISFTKGCYPGQEPVARLHYRGHVNRSLRLVRLDGTELPPSEAEISSAGKSVGRVTSAVPANGSVLALAYLRTEVPDGATVLVDGVEGTVVRGATISRSTRP
jgi:folate-binding protein YgfZ